MSTADLRIGPERRVLQPLLESYPAVMDVSELAEASGYSRALELRESGEWQELEGSLKSRIARPIIGRR